VVSWAAPWVLLPLPPHSPPRQSRICDISHCKAITALRPCLEQRPALCSCPAVAGLHKCATPAALLPQPLPLLPGVPYGTAHPPCCASACGTAAASLPWLHSPPVLGVPQMESAWPSVGLAIVHAAVVYALLASFIAAELACTGVGVPICGWSDLAACRLAWLLVASRSSSSSRVASPQKKTPAAPPHHPPPPTSIMCPLCSLSIVAHYAHYGRYGTGSHFYTSSVWA
jgi:hypothetical protein